MDIQVEVGQFLDKIFIVLSPTPQREELYFILLGEGTKQYENLLEQGETRETAFTIVQDTISNDARLEELFRKNDNVIWNKKEKEQIYRRKAFLRVTGLLLILAAIVIAILAFVVGQGAGRVTWLSIAIFCLILGVLLQVMLVQLFPSISDLSEDEE